MSVEGHRIHLEPRLGQLRHEEREVQPSDVEQLPQSLFVDPQFKNDPQVFEAEAQLLSRNAGFESHFAYVLLSKL